MPYAPVQERKAAIYARVSGGGFDLEAVIVGKSWGNAGLSRLGLTHDATYRRDIHPRGVSYAVLVVRGYTELDGACILHVRDS